VAELLERISSRELTQWMEFFEQEPWGFDAEIFGHAITASTIANKFRGKHEQPYKVSDFMPKHGKEEPQSIEQQLEFAAVLTAAFGGQDLRGEGEAE
jgi:hypothetical protein